MRKSLICLMAVALMFTSVGCRHNTANMANPKVALAVGLTDAANTCLTLEDGLTATYNALDQLETSEPEYYAHVKPLVQKLSASNVMAMRVIQKVQAGDTTADWRGAMVVVANTVKPSDLTMFNFKNPNSQALANSLFQAVVATITEMTQKYRGVQ